MKCFFFFIVFLLVFFPFASAEKINDLEVDWGGVSSYTLSWSNPSISKDGYTIKVLDFNWLGDAGVEVSRNGEKQHGILSNEENSYFNFTQNTTYYQGVRILPKKVSRFYPLPVNIGTYPCCPAAEIEVSVAQPIEKKPKMELTLETDWDGRAGVTSILRIRLNNTGDIDFSSGNITINLSGLQPAVQRELSDNSLYFNPSKGNVTRSWDSTFTVNSIYYLNLSVKPPGLPLPDEQTTFNIKVDSYFRDNKGNIYPSTASAEVSLKPAVNIDKKISAGTILGDKYFKRENYVGWVSLSKTTVVNLIVKNLQSYPVNVSLTDTVPDNFNLTEIVYSASYNATANNTKLHWTFPINASETKEFKYELKAGKTGSFRAPAAVATWDEWGMIKSAYSNQPETRVYGVFVVISKTIDRPDVVVWQKVNVTLNLENIGDFPVGLNVTDVLPAYSQLLYGTTEFSDYLYPKQSMALTYTISPERIGEFELASPSVTFWNKDFEGSFAVIPSSNITVLGPIVPTPIYTATPTTTVPLSIQTPAPKSLIAVVNENVPWLEGSFPIIMIFISIIIMLALNYIKR